MPTLDKNLLDILVCPVTGAAVQPMQAAQLAAFNEQARAGKLHYADGQTVGQPLDAALVTVDGVTAYRIDDGIPVMLPSRGINIPN